MIWATVENPSDPGEEPYPSSWIKAEAENFRRLPGVQTVELPMCH